MNKQRAIEVLLPYRGEVVYSAQPVRGVHTVFGDWPSKEVKDAVQSVTEHVPLECPADFCHIYRVSDELEIEELTKYGHSVKIRTPSRRKDGWKISYVPLYALLLSPEDEAVLPDGVGILLKNDRHLLVAVYPGTAGYFNAGEELRAILELRDQLEEQWAEPKLMVQLVGAPSSELSRDRKTATLHYVLPFGRVVKQAAGRCAYTEGFLLLSVEVPQQPSQRAVVMEFIVGRAEEYERCRNGEAKPIRASEPLVAAFTNGLNYEAAAQKLFRESRDRVTA